MATITPITKEDLKSWNIKFITIDAPIFAIRLKKNCKTVFHYFKTKDEAKEFIEKYGTQSPIIMYDVETVCKNRATRVSKLVKEDCFYIRLADINKVDFTTVYDNIKKSQNVIYTFKWDFSNFK